MGIYATISSQLKRTHTRSKSKASTTLYGINWDVRVLHEIFMDNAPNQNGYNTEMKKTVHMEILEIRTTGPYSTYQNKAVIVIKIIEGKSNRRIIQINTPNKFLKFGMVW